MVEIAVGGKRRAQAGQQREDPRAQTDAKRKAAPLAREIVTAVRERDTGRDGEDQQRETRR
jgi:hypothetical protein